MYRRTPIVPCLGALILVGMTSCQEPVAAPPSPASPAPATPTAAAATPTAAAATPTAAAPAAAPTATSAAAPLTPAAALILAPTVHPRLFAREDDFRRAAAGTSPAQRRALDALAQQARVLAPLPPLERRLDGRRLLGISRAALLRISTLAACYRLHGDRAAGQAAITNLRAVCHFQDWNPAHFLDVAEMTLAVAIGYDWCYDLLDDTDRRDVREALLTKGLEPSFITPVPFWVAGTNNWSQVCHGGLLAGALVVHDDAPDVARRIVERAVANLPASMSAMYDPSGNYPEGPMYWSYGTHYNLIAIEALRSVLGQDFGLGSHAGLRASGTFWASAHGVTGAPFCYGDCDPAAPTWSANAAALAWLARENHQADLMPQQPEPAWKPGTDSSNRFLALLPLWLAPPNEAPALPLDYHGTGHRHIVTCRSAWNAPNGTYVGITGGSPSNNHAHMDVGSFVYETAGVRWACDLGMHSYSPLEQAGVDLWNSRQDSQRWKVFRLSQAAHNVLVLPGGAQQVAGRAECTDVQLGGPSPTATLDLSSIYAGQAHRVTRQMTLEQRRDLHLVDRIERLTTGGAVTWQLVTKATVEPAADGRNAVLRQDGHTLRVQVLAPNDARLRVEPATPTAPGESPNPGVVVMRWSAPVSAGATCTWDVRLAAP